MEENTLPRELEAGSCTLDELARLGAQEILRQYLESEISSFLSFHKSKKLSNGHAAVIRNGYHKERSLATGTGSVQVKVPRSRDLSNAGIVFSSAIVPKYMRRSLQIDEAIPLLYLLGISTNNMSTALEKLLGPGVSGLSSANIPRLKSCWEEEYRKWRKRDLSGKQYCYLWADGIHFTLRHEESRVCILVLVGALADGTKELIAVESGYRESGESWSGLLRDIRDRGMAPAKLLIGDGALGLWKAVKDIYPQTKWQRCWVHKTANVLDKMPKGVQPTAKRMIHDIYRAENKKEAKKAYERFQSRYAAKYPEAVKCLTKDEDSLFTFYSFPAEQWRHIRSTNVIESTFSTVRNRTKSTRGHGTIQTTLMMVFKLLEKAAKRWKKLQGYALIEKVMNDVEFEDGIEVKNAA